MAKADRLAWQAKQKALMAELAEMPTWDVAKLTARAALPETKKEAIVEGGLIVGSAVVTGLISGAMTPALIAAGSAIASIAVYNVATKAPQQVLELAHRATDYSVKKAAELTAKDKEVKSE